MQRLAFPFSENFTYILIFFVKYKSFSCKYVSMMTRHEAKAFAMLSIAILELAFLPIPTRLHLFL